RGAAMAINLQCPGCKKNLKTKDDLVGKRVKCPGCGQLIMVPAASPPSEPKEITPSQGKPPVPKKPEPEVPTPSRPPLARGRSSFWTKPLFGTGLVRKDSPEDRGDLWARVTANGEPEVQVVFDLAAFPGA